MKIEVDDYHKKCLINVIEHDIDRLWRKIENFERTGFPCNVEVFTKHNALCDILSQLINK